MPDLHARLLAEIDVAIVDAIGAQSKLSRGMERLLRALRKVVELHRVEQFGETIRSFQGHALTRTWDECVICGGVERGCCDTIAAVAEALGVTV